MQLRKLTYASPGCTSPATSSWVPPDGFRTYEKTVMLGHGNDTWAHMHDEILQWAVKTRSGFRVENAHGSSVGVAAGEDVWLIASFGPAEIREPIRIIEVVDTPNRCGYSYGTLEGHPVSGEEAFVVHRLHDDVFFTVRSLTRPGVGKWRLLFPAVLIAQRLYRRRYLTALVGQP